MELNAWCAAAAMLNITTACGMLPPMAPKTAAGTIAAHTSCVPRRAQRVSNPRRSRNPENQPAATLPAPPMK